VLVPQCRLHQCPGMSLNSSITLFPRSRTTILVPEYNFSDRADEPCCLIWQQTMAPTLARLPSADDFKSARFTGTSPIFRRGHSNFSRRSAKNQLYRLGIIIKGIMAVMGCQPLKRRPAYTSLDHGPALSFHRLPIINP
jgi:hypothetical protein